MHDAQENRALRWIREELDASLRQASESLERYAEAAGGKQALSEVIASLHQVHGSLQMLQLYGAAMLAEEMELVARALWDERLKRQQDATEALMLGLIRLPGYLEKLEGGLRDRPILLLPELNELRAVREEPLLSEVALFAPELERRLLSDEDEGEPSEELRQRARQLRHHYHLALLDLFRGDNRTKGLRLLQGVLFRLEKVAGTRTAIRLLRSARALVASLEEGSLEVGVATNLLIGKVDRVLKAVIDHGEQQLQVEPVDDLLKNLLYYVATTDSELPLVQELQERYALHNSLATQGERQAFDRPDRELYDSLQQAISEDLGQLKDGLDLYIRSGESDLSRLGQFAEPMRKLADTLGMVGEGALRQKLKQQADRINQLVEQQQVPDESDLMAMAGDILFVETSLKNLSLSRGSHIEEHSELPRGEFDRLLGSVMREAGIDLSHNKEAILAYLGDPAGHPLAVEVVDRFRNIAGALGMLNQEQGRAMLERVASYCEHSLVGHETPPAEEELDHFADAVTAIEYFIEAVVDGRGIQQEILTIAQEALDQLPASEVQREPSEVEAQSAAADASAVIADELAEDIPVQAPGSEEVSQASKEEVAQGDEAEKQADREVEPGIPLARSQPHGAQDKELDEVDPEILEIFLEEAREELEVIRELLPRWLEDQDDLEALHTFRRSFHTLKGSGRLVGAKVIGEFSWSIENMLNRVIDQTIGVTPEMERLLEGCLEVLPELVEAQAAKRLPAIDVAPMMERAFSLAGVAQKVPPMATSPLADTVAAESTGEPAPGELTEELQQQTISQESTEDVLPKASGGEPAALQMDETLSEIFRSESETHIQTLEAFLAHCRESHLPGRLDSGLTRALHTLHGSADMAGVEPIAEVSTALEAYVNLLKQRDQLADEAVQGLIEESIGVFRDTLAAINVAGSSLPDWQGLLERIQGEAEAAQAQREPQEPTAESAQESQEVEAPEEERPGGDTELEPVAEFVDQRPDRHENMIPLQGDVELLDIFLEEAQELLEAIERAFAHWCDQQDGAVDELERHLHTLKGGARLAGAMPVGDLSHAFESLLTAIGHGRLEASEGVVGLGRQVVDRIAEQIEDLLSGPMVRDDAGLIRALEATLRGETLGAETLDDLEPETDSVAGVDELADGETGAPEPESAPDSAIQFEEEKAEAPEQGRTETGAAASPVLKVSTETSRTIQALPKVQREQVRVRSDLLDRLVNHAGEVSIYRARLEQQNSNLGFNLGELEQTVDRLRNQLRQLEIETEAQILFRYEQEGEESQELEKNLDPLELDRFSTMQQLSRSLMETVNDLGSINKYLEELQRENETLLLQQSRISTDLQDGLLRTRMVPFAQLVPRLQRVVRQTSRSLGKQAELTVRGAEGELDRGILDRMIGPLEHLLRNAVYHGIEMPAQRRDQGKPETGEITIALRREGTDVLLDIGDDGRGLDTDAIRARAIETGLMAASAEMNDNDLLQFVLQHGFSTADEVTQISGRGVGLDVVVNEVRQLGGSLDISSSPGVGSHFQIRLPLTLAISDALLVELGEEIYAIPHTSTEGVVRVSRQELEACYNGTQDGYQYAGQRYKLRYLGQMIHGSAPMLSEQRKWYPLLLVRAGDHRVALQVDNLIGNRQIVVKSVGIQVGTVRWISGGTILGDGRVALILDVAALVRLDLAHAPATEEAPLPDTPAEPGFGRLVMVVDDSITVRRVTSRLLERHGMQVITAKDGVDAVAQLQEFRPDLMLLDIEMPRMDGYELARHMRNSEELSGIPIIMITSRSGEKHRRIAMDLGVKRYLGKPYQEDDLLQNIYLVLGEEVSADE